MYEDQSANVDGSETSSHTGMYVENKNAPRNSYFHNVSTQTMMDLILKKLMIHCLVRNLTLQQVFLMSQSWNNIMASTHDLVHKP